MVVPDWHRQIEQSLYEAVNGRHLDQIRSPYDVCYALRCIVDDDRKMIGGRLNILASEHHVAKRAQH